MVEDTWTATEETLAHRIELGTDRPDFMSPVIENNRTDGKGLSKPEILANAWLLSMLEVRPQPESWVARHFTY